MQDNTLTIIENGILEIDRYVNNDYLIGLNQHEVVPLNDEQKHCNVMRFFNIKKLVLDVEDNITDKLVSIYAALHDVDASLIMILDGKPSDVQIYLGVMDNSNPAMAGKILSKALKGNFPGTELESLKNPEIEDLLKRATVMEGHDAKSVSAITVVPSERDDDEDYVQGLEKFLDTMQGHTYTAMFISSPIGKNALAERRLGFETLSSQLSPLSKTTLSYCQNRSEAFSNSVSDSFTESVNKGISNTLGSSHSYGTSYSSGRSHSFSISGQNLGTNSGTSHNHGVTTNESQTESVSMSISQGKTTGETNTQTIGDSNTFTVERTNKTVDLLVKKIDMQLDRIAKCESFGMWSSAAYFISTDVETAAMAASTYKALIQGDNSSVENSYFNLWDYSDDSRTNEILKYLEAGKHPLIMISGEGSYESHVVTPATCISGREMPLLMGLPQKSVSGLPVIQMTGYGRNVRHNGRCNGKTVEIGKIYHMGITEEKNVDLDLDSFTSHCFITGSTGSGKSNTVYCLLENFHEKGVPFLIIEPAKGEYKTELGGMEDVNVFSTNPYVEKMLKLNPFRFNQGTHVLEHIDRLIEVFNACWEMYAAMPAILKDAIEHIYMKKQWDLDHSIYIGSGTPEYPTFSDLLEELPRIISRSGYSDETKGNYIGALVTRVASLANGISGQIFCDCYDIPDDALFDTNTIVDLSRVGSAETKSLIMGILVLKLSEYRSATSKGENQPLKHITVLEEAHNLLKRTGPSQGENGSNVIGKSVEMISNAIAEMRTYGEGFIIVDQSPSAVDIAAIKNTNTKIVMRLPEKGDCDAIGHSIFLDDNQIRELSRLPVGVAVVMQNNWIEAVSCSINRSSGKYHRAANTVSFDALKDLRSSVVNQLIVQYSFKQKMDSGEMVQAIANVNAPAFKKEELTMRMESVMDLLKQGNDTLYFCQTLLNLSEARDLFKIKESLIKRSKDDSGLYDMDSLRRWKDDFLEHLGKYVEIDEHFRESLFKAMLYAKGQEKDSVDYENVFEQLFGEKNAGN